MDIWVASNRTNAEKVVQVLCEFGFSTETVMSEIFERPNQVIRMGVPPICIDVITSASGVDFSACYARRQTHTVDEVEIAVIHPDDLRANKKASARPKDLDDLEHLP